MAGARLPCRLKVDLMKQASPTIIWVVGDNTNVGKTTISAALIRMLNAAGKTTVGFKPYAGGRLIDVIDLLGEIAVGDGLLVGRDARKLAKASPLISGDLLEVTNPSWRLSHPHRDASVFVRKGAAAIGRRDFFYTDNTQELRNRPDFQQINQLFRLPTPGAILPDQSADKVDYSDQGIQRACFERLLQLAPTAVVCEGAGRLLPVWAGAPLATHIFLIIGGDLHLFPNARIGLTHAQGADFGPFTIGALGSALKGQRSFKAPIPLVLPSLLDTAMDRFVRNFVPALL